MRVGLSARLIGLTEVSGGCHLAPRSVRVVHPSTHGATCARLVEHANPDNNGRRVRNAALDGLGHRGCWLDLSSWDASRFPSTLTFSFDAGAYLCNETYHATLKSLCNAHHTHSDAAASVVSASSIASVHRRGRVRSQRCAWGTWCAPIPSQVTHVVAMCLREKMALFSLAQRADDEADASLVGVPRWEVRSQRNMAGVAEREIAEELTRRCLHDIPHVVPNPRTRSLRRSPDPGGAGYAGRNGATLGASSDGLGEHHVVNGAHAGEVETVRCLSS